MEGCAKIMYIRVRRGAQTVPLPQFPANCGQFTIIYDLPTRRRSSSSRETWCLNVKVNTARFSLRVPSLSPFHMPYDRVKHVPHAHLPTWCNRGKRPARVSRALSVFRWSYTCTECTIVFSRRESIISLNCNWHLYVLILRSRQKYPKLLQIDILQPSRPHFRSSSCTGHNT